MNFFDGFQLILLVGFYAVFVIRTAILSMRGQRVIVLGRGKKGFGAVLELAFLVLLPLWTAEIITRSLKIETQWQKMFLFDEFMSSFFLKITGVSIIIAGFTVFILALISFGTSWRVGIDKNSPGALVTSGMFFFSRNPVFLFLDLYFLGAFFIYSSIFFLASFLLLASGIHYQILQEEKFLKGHYGKEYINYKKMVRRYI